ncbi:MAG: hypothetical protein V2A58_03040, partial [Planctomycetota bacterium]
GVVDFPEEFGVRDFLAELSLVASIGSAVRSATARRAAEKEFCAAFFPNLPDEEKARIAHEIEETP